MSTYFVDPYKKYYDKLVLCTDIVQESKNLEESFSNSVQIIDTLKAQLQSGVSKELGYQELINSVIPGLSSSIQAVKDNITDGLVVASSIAINELLACLQNLKDEDEKYENIKNSINNLVYYPRYDSSGNETSEYKNYITEKNRLEKDLYSVSEKCLQYQGDADSFINEIKKLDGNMIAFNTNNSSQSTNDTFSFSSVVADSNNKNLLNITYNGEEYYLVNTKIPVLDYSLHVQKNRMYQNAGALNGQCMIASQIYARDLLRGTYTSYRNFVNKTGSPATRINERVISNDKNDVLRYVYEEVALGHPVVLQVTQKKSNIGLRHLVTVVGFKKSVTSFNDLKDSDLLVLDNVDGKVQNLSDRNRTLYNQANNGYQALGPTEAFLAKEVSPVINA